MRIYVTTALLPAALLIALGTLWACGGDGAAADASQDLIDDAPTDTDPFTYSEEREACTDRNPLRNLYWGDLHVHTALSFDAYVFDTRNGPAEAYAFARGEPIQLSPLGDDDVGTVSARLDRPLDFAAVSDHAEFLGEISVCTDPEAAGYETDACADIRAGDNRIVSFFAGQLTVEEPARNVEVCGEDGSECTTRAASMWEQIRQINEDYYDRSADCEFTTLVSYEWSAVLDSNNMHRVVLFRNGDVPDLPTSYYDAQHAPDLWDRLERDCLNADGNCDVMAIPHNSNLSAGNIFLAEYPGTSSDEEAAAFAERRARLEPLVEIIQHKGDSECVNGYTPIFGAVDEQCGFEKLHEMAATNQQDCGEFGGQSGMSMTGCVSGRDFVRNALVIGLQEEQRLGVNPYPLGFVGATDTHNAVPGLVEENDYPGHWGSNEDTIEVRLRGRNGAGIIGGRYNNPGGLTAAWATENSRDGIFDAMQARETYATSGPRIPVRFFGGWDFEPTMCESADMVAEAYQRGVAMGGYLEGGSSGAPTFLVSAMRDSGGLQTDLQRIQIVKGWVDSNGEGHTEVFDVAGDAENGAAVNLDTCERTGEGFASLCTVWSDPDFDANQRAFYYARVLENPSCRWTQYQCIALSAEERPDGCNDENIPATIQERAWTSPIFYSP